MLKYFQWIWYVWDNISQTESFYVIKDITGLNGTTFRNADERLSVVNSV
jgi:hypothetical protein